MGENMIGPNYAQLQKTSEARRETLFERCGIDRTLYLSCKAVIEGTLAPFSVGSPNDGGLLHIGGQEAARYVCEYERRQEAREPKRRIFSKFLLDCGKNYMGDMENGGV